MHKLLILFIAFFFSCSGRAQNHVIDDSISAVSDTNEISPADTTAAAFDISVLGDTTATFHSLPAATDSVSAWKSKSQYAWSRDIDSLLRDYQDRQKDKPSNRKPTGSSTFARLFSSSLLPIFFWTAAAIFVAFIIYRLFLNRGLFATGGKKAVRASPAETEEISGRDFRALAQNSAAAGNLSLAVRWLFLLTLQQLGERKLIVFAADKTNYAYLRELPENRRNDFATLALYYEYIWYGKTPLSEDVFESVRKKFEEFLKHI